ncbi:hypothetical protein [Clostridium sp. E02]|uniref:hypothetical protein n=1 Tax=Clostridium sp. E02 TaxID=2487134 RepID=UPI0019D2F7A0|nr:hypothetical protein [Clostridium sp. E02]
MDIAKFSKKLNKIDGNIYVMEEKVDLVGGVYNAPLQHGNINTFTLAVYSGPKLTGKKIQSYTLSTPSHTPWKQVIRIYANVPTVYISYETEGDTVEAEDVNRLQEEMARTQEAVNAEASRAKISEEDNADKLTAETTRAKMVENILEDNLSAEKTRAISAEDAIRSMIQSNKPNWEDKYTRNEVDNKFSALENAIDWKESVATFADIAEVYPDPQDGWTVNVKDTDYTYRYSGSAWVVISANAIPKATQSVDGLLTKEDKTSYDDANSKKHTHSNQSLLDEVTKPLVDRWNAAHAHVSDTVRHVTAEERKAWNTVSEKVDTVEGKGLSTNDYTNSEKNKLAKVAAGAEVNVQADWNESDSTSDAFIKSKPSSLPANGGSAERLSNAIQIIDYDAFVPIKVLQGSITPVRADNNAKSPWLNTTSGFLIQSNYTDSWHLLIFRSGGEGWAYRSFYNNKWGSWKIWSTFDGKYSSLFDKPNKVSAFENDTGYITAADVDISQNHVHANKSVLDKITQAFLDHWDAAYIHVGDKNNPHEVTAAQVGAAAAGHKHKKNDISDFPSTMPANGGDAATVNGHAVNADVPSSAKFTDTVYTHPNSGVTARTYKSVTVNAQGHVTGGTNPTTLAGYGITDAASKTHNHDSTYLKETGLTWDDLKGV